MSMIHNLKNAVLFTLILVGASIQGHRAHAAGTETLIVAGRVFLVRRK